MLLRTTTETPLGEMTIVATDRGIVATILDDPAAELERVEDRFDSRAKQADRSLTGARRELRDYFAGRRRALTHRVDLRWAGGGFFRRAYEAAMAVPYGEVCTYGDLASAAGSPRAWRAAGHAMRVSPIELWIPCHRIVPAGPGWGTYGGHPDRREFLLELEASS
jgi:methylated-DNA-[protein]-cysteine S-methyltransferase